MKHNLHFGAGTILVTAFAITLEAQAPATSTAQSERTTPGKVTMTGCVERADQIAGSGPAAATVDSLTFVLTHAISGPADDSKSGPVGTSGTAGTGTAATSAT